MMSDEIFNAAERKDLKEVKMLIETKGVSPTITKFGKTLAHVAVLKGDLVMLEYLLEKDNSLAKIKYDVKRFLHESRSLLDLAVGRGHLEIVKCLVENHDADIYEVFRSRYTAINWAVIKDHLHIVKYFIEERHVDVNKPPIKENDRYEFRPRPLLLDAIANKRYAIIHYLIKEKNANLTVIDNKYENILYTFLQVGDLDSVRYILFEKEPKIDLNCQDNGRSHSLINLLVRNFKLKNVENILQYLVRKQCTDWDTPFLNGQKTLLHYAARCLSLETIKCLIDSGADIDKQDSDGNTALHFAVFESVRRGIEICKYLCERGANLMKKNNVGKTPLDIAVNKLTKEDNMFELCELFIEQGANLNLTDVKGNQLVHKVIKKNEIHLLDYLVRNKHVDINTRRETDNSTPLHCAAFWNHLEMCKYLIEHGALIDEKNKDNETPLGMAMKRFSKENNEGKKKLIFKFCRLFIDHGASVNSTFGEGNQLVHFAALRNDIRLLDYLIRDEKVDINTPRKTDNWTPLHCAASRDHFDICVYLIRQGADIRAKSKCGKTPAQVASDQDLIDFIGNTSTTTRCRRRVKNFLPTLLHDQTYLEYTYRSIAGPGNGKTIKFFGEDYTFGLQDFFSYIYLVLRYFVKSSYDSPHTFVSTTAGLQSRMNSIAEKAINDFSNFTDA